MDFLQHLTDDQTALLGCFGALVIAMGMLSLSFHTNPDNKKLTDEETAPELKVTPQEQVEERRRAA